MTLDLSHLDSLASGRKEVVTYTFRELADVVELDCTLADSSNPVHHEALLKVGNRLPQYVIRPRGDADRLKQARWYARLYARLHVKGMRGLRDAHGDVVSFSPDTALAFLNKLISVRIDYFQAFQAFICNPENFYDRDDEGDDDDGVDVMGNS